MANDPLNRAFAPTVPPDPLDPPRFGNVKSTTKDVFVYNLRSYFDRSKTTAARFEEDVTLEKYDTAGDGTDPYESVLKVVRRYPDILQRLPHVVVLTTSLTQRPFSVGPPLLTAVQFPPQITAAFPEPYNIQNGDQLVVVTSPVTVAAMNLPPPTSTLIFNFSYCPTTSSVGNVLAADAAAMINAQALYVKASTTMINGQNFLVLATGGPLGQKTPNSIEVQPSSTPSLLTAFGWSHSGTATSITGTPPAMTLHGPAGTFTGVTFGLENGSPRVVLSNSPDDLAFYNDGEWEITDVALDGSTLSFTSPYSKTSSDSVSWFVGARDDSKNPARVPYNRYGYLFDVGLQIQVLADDDQTRDQVSDLISSYLTFFMEQQLFCYFGQTNFDPTILGQDFSIIIKSDLTTSSEDEIPIGASGTDKIYAEVFNLTCHVSQFINRSVIVPSGPSAGQGWQEDADDVAPDPTLPLPS